MVFLPDGRWWWNSQGKNGHAIDFIQHYEGKNYTEAILLLAGTLDAPASVGKVMQFIPEKVERKLFELPERADNYKIMFAYGLCIYPSAAECVSMASIFGGCPVKIFKQGEIYHPKTFWMNYSINYDRDEVIREDKSNCVILRRLVQRELKNNESVKSLAR